MTIHHFSPLVSMACSLVAVVMSGWSVWRVKFAYRKRGRRAVERLIAARGETLVAIKEAPPSALRATAGLSAAVIFEVRARTAQGDERTYHWGYAPRVFPWQTEGVQRLAHGIWIPA